VPVNSTHPDYASNCDSWQRIRDVVLGDAAIKARGEKYVARLDSQTDAEFHAYVTARDGIMLGRRPGQSLPDPSG